MYINMCPRGVLHILHVYIFVLYLASYYVTSTAVNRVHVKKPYYMYVPRLLYSVCNLHMEHMYTCTCALHESQ